MQRGFANAELLDFDASAEARGRRLRPGLFQYTQPIPEAQFLDQRLAVIALAHDLHEVLQASGVLDAGRNGRPVEIRSKPDAVLTDMFDHMLDVRDHQIDGRVGVLTAVLAQETGREINADHAAGFADPGELLISEVAGVRAQGMGVGMRRHQRRVAERSDIPEPALIEMRKVDQDPEPVAGTNEFLAQVGQAGASIRRRGTAKWHAMPERIWP